MKITNRTSIMNLKSYTMHPIDLININILKSMYKFMLRLRKCQEALIKEYHPANEMRCPVHFCIGQEAAPAALSVLLTQNDYLFSHHRSHGYFLAKTSSLRPLFAELYGRATGANGGLAGSQEISMHSSNFYSGAILTGMPAIAVGTALSFQIKNVPYVSVAGFGDGASDQGIFWETVNFAALKKLPVILLCENNGYSTYSPQLKRQCSDNLSERVMAFGIRSQAIFGNDVVAMYYAIQEAIRNARDGKGPSFIEAYTYRMNPHVGPEDDDYLNYRPKEDLEFWRENCPIKLLEEMMLRNGILSEHEKNNLVSDIEYEIEEAFKFAKSSPFPENPNWASLNYALNSPVADRLLTETKTEIFDQNQADTIPKPY